MSSMVETYGRYVSVSVSHSPLLHTMDKVCLRGEQRGLDLDVKPGLSLPFTKK
jgi:hypothetical protein